MAGCAGAMYRCGSAPTPARPSVPPPPSTSGVASAPPAARPGLSPAALALWVAVAHGANDAYAAFLPPLLPRIMGELGLSVALAATLIMTFSVSQSLLQPAAGYVADRVGPRFFVVAGPLLSGVFLSLLGWAPNLAGLLVLLVFGGLGSALFHPPGASYAARVKEGRGSGLRFSIFSFGGAVGFALGPLIAVGLVGRLGLPGLAWAMVPVLLLAPVLWAVLPSGRPRDEVRDGEGDGGRDEGRARPPGPRAVLRLLKGPLGLIFGISAVAAFGQRVFTTFMPLVAAGDGRSEAAGAAVLSVYLGAQAVGTLAGGLWTDRGSRVRLLMVLTVVALPAHAVALGAAAGSVPGLAAAAVAGFVNMAMLPPLVILAQELVPDGAAVGSGIAMGLAWGAGSLLLPLSGMLGDLWGPRGGALASLPLYLLAVALTVVLGGVLRRRREAGA